MPSAYEIVKECRGKISKDIKGDALLPVLAAAVSALGLPAGEKPYATQIDRFCGKRAPRDAAKAIAKGLDPDPDNCLIRTLKFRAYPTINADLTKFDEWAEKANFFWIAAARQIQHALRNKHWPRLKVLTSPNEYKDYLDKIVGDRLPIEIKRDLLKRFAIVLKKAKENKNGKGYPSDVEGMERMTIDIPFNGGGFGSYVKIGDPYFPANHHGPRSGKYRRLREMRAVRLRLNTSMPWFDFDVLFHQALPPGFPKSAKIMKCKGNRWYVMFSIESKLPDALPGRNFAGLDYNWRMNGESLSTLDIGSDLLERKTFSLSFSANRRARRQQLNKSKDAVGLPPFLPTPEGRKAYQKAMDLRKDALKTAHKLHEKMGWRGIRELAKSGTLTSVAQAEFEATIAWYERALQQYSFMCEVEVANRDRQYREAARSVLLYCQQYGISDVGSPDDSYKEMAEEERDPDLENFESHIMNVRDRNRQIVAPGRLREIVEWTLRKNGIRVHRVNPWKTSQRCACGADTKSRNEHFNCSGCGKRLHRSDVAVANAARLARECADGDCHARVCSRDGKDKPFHGFHGCDEAIKAKKAEKKAKVASRSRKAAQVLDNQVVAPPAAAGE